VAAAPIAETIVHAGDAAMQSMVKSAAVKRAGVKPTAVKPAAVASTSAMRSVGEVWRAEHGNAQHSSCGASQSPSDPGPGAICG
jgi:hypothetical protein